MAIRPAAARDEPEVRGCVDAAYAVYLPRMETRPAPMLADYGRLIAAGEVHVLEEDGRILGLIVLRAEDDHLFIDNLAVHPEAQGRGLGRRLLDFAEGEARRLGLPELRLYTNQAMTENLAFYPRLGYEETGRREDEGYRRVFFRKRVP